MNARPFVLIGAFLFAVSASSAFAGNYIELQNVITSDGLYDPTIDALFGERFNGGSIGWSAFLLTCQGWSEALVGPTWSPRPWMELWGGVGVETDDNPTRYSGSLWLGNQSGTRSLIFIREEGGSGHWNKGVAQFSVPVSAMSFGVHYQTPYGVGPHTSYGCPLGTLWASILVDLDEGGTGIVGLVRKF